MTTEEITDKIMDALSESYNLKRAMEVACTALASVIAQGDAELDREAIEYNIELLKTLVHEWRKKYEESKTEQVQLIQKINADLMNPDIPIEQIVDKYCTFGSDELRQSTIDELRLLRVEILEQTENGINENDHT